MLILCRHESETIVLQIPPSAEPREVTIMVTDIRSETVRLGITAPKNVNVVRSELLETKTPNASSEASC